MGKALEKRGRARVKLFDIFTDDEEMGQAIGDDLYASVVEGPHRDVKVANRHMRRDCGASLLADPS